MDQELHQLVQDNDGHWYLIPVVYQDTFNEMMNIEWDEITKEGWKKLDEWRINGHPSKIEFMWPISN